MKTTATMLLAGMLLLAGGCGSRTTAEAPYIKQVMNRVLRGELAFEETREEVARATKAKAEAKAAAQKSKRRGRWVFDIPGFETESALAQSDVLARTGAHELPPLD